MNNDGTSALAIVPNEAKLFGKMARVMGIINRVPKSGNNTFHKYKYATADDVADTIRDAMAEVNLALIVQMGDVRQETIEYESSNKTTKTIRTTINFNFIFACGDTGAVVSSPWTSQVDDNSDKAVNKCATAAEKYFLMKTFIVSAGDEPDSDADKHREEAGRKVTPKWYEEDNRRALHEMSERAFTAGLIKERNGKGVAEMEAMIAPKTWADYTDRAAAALAIKEIVETRRQAAAQSASAGDTTASTDMQPNIRADETHIITAPDSPFAQIPANPTPAPAVTSNGGEPAATGATSASPSYVQPPF